MDAVGRLGNRQFWRTSPSVQSDRLAAGERTDVTITATVVRQLLRYEPETGIFTWLIRSRPQNPAGSPAGSVNAVGYVSIVIAQKAYLAHRLAWLYVTGGGPTSEIDHRDGNRSNNRWNNLRLAVRSENMHNAKTRSDNTSGFKGVCFHKPSGLFRGDLQTYGKRQSTRYFRTAKEAAEALALLRLQYHGEFARHA